jgi:hypothetical protein
MSIEFKLTRDPQLLEQYYALREKCFQEDLGISDFDGSEDDSDRQGQIFLAIQDGRCIGGARISRQLPKQGYHHELNLQSQTCCIWERSFLDPAVRTLQLFRDFCTHLVEISRVLGYHHALVLSSLRNARFYRKCHSAMGIGFQIHRHVPDCAQGAFAGLEHYVSVSRLREPHLQLVKPLKMAA